jgi:hypothetical protein
MASAVLVGKKISYPLRIRIERELFRIAVDLADRYTGVKLAGCDEESVALVLRTAQACAPREVRFALLLVFELKAALAVLSSGDPYLSKDLTAEPLRGHQSAREAFSRKLVRVANLVVTM